MDKMNLSTIMSSTLRVQSHREANYGVYCRKAEVVVVLAFHSPSVRFVIRLSRDSYVYL